MPIPQLYHDWVLWIGDGTGLPDTILYIYAVLAILLLVRVVTGRLLATFIPFAAVVVAEVGNELMDYLVYDLAGPTPRRNRRRCPGHWLSAWRPLPADATARSSARLKGAGA